MDEKETWIKVADDVQEVSFKENGIASIKIGDKEVCLFKTIAGLKACAEKCPHAGGDLSKGFLDNRGNIVCPVHGYRFSVQTGRDATGEGYFLKIYKVLQNDEGIFIKLE